MRFQGQTVSREMLARDVWQVSARATPIDNVIDVHIARLRKEDGRSVRCPAAAHDRGVGFLLEESRHEGRRSSIRTRLTLWYTAVVLLTLGVLFDRGIYSSVRASLEARAGHATGTRFGTVSTALVRHSARPGRRGTLPGDVLFTATEACQAIHHSTPAPRQLHQTLFARPAGTIRAAAITEPGGRTTDQGTLRVGERPRPEGDGGGRCGRSATDAAGLLSVFLWSIPGAVLLAIAGGYFLAGRALLPVSAMAAKSREITAEALSERLPVGNPDDELGRMATVFNETLARLEASFERLRNFTADVSHELRTPLTAIRSVGKWRCSVPTTRIFCGM